MVGRVRALSQSAPAVSALLPLFCALLAFALRLTNLDGLGLWGDEGWSLYLAHRSLAELTLETGSDIHPPLYYYLLYFWRHIAGSSEFAARYLSVFPGVTVVAVAYPLGRRLANGRVAATGALLTACAPFAVYYAQEVRPFMWATLWCACALYLLLRAMDSPSRALWAGYAVLSLLSAFTLYSTACWFAAHGVLVLARREWRRRFLTWLGVELGVLALTVPWLLLFGRVTGAHLTGQGAFTGRQVLPVYTLVGRAIAGLLSGVTLPATTMWITAGVALACAIAGVLLARPPARAAAALLALLVLLSVLALYPIHMFFPWFEPRVLAFCVVPLCLFLAVGLEGWWMHGWWTFAAASVVLTIVCGMGLYDYYARYSRYSPELEDYRPLIAHVQERATSGDVMLYNAPWHVGYFSAYYRGPPLDFHAFSSVSVAQVEGSARQVWLVLRDIVRQPGGDRAEDRAEDVLSGRSFKVGEAWFGHIRLAHYVTAPPGKPMIHPLDWVLGRQLPSTPELRLIGFAVQPDPGGDVIVVEPGQAVYLTLIWRGERALDRPYHVFSHVIGPLNPATGNPVWAQHDGVPGNQDRPTTTWGAGERIVDRHVMWVDDAAPAGEYALEVGMYEPGTGARLAAMARDSSLTDHITLARVRVVAP